MKTNLTAANDNAGHRPTATVDVSGLVVLLARAAARRAANDARPTNINEAPSKRITE